jgi:hypothetical protein
MAKIREALHGALHKSTTKAGIFFGHTMAWKWV